LLYSDPEALNDFLHGSETQVSTLRGKHTKKNHIQFFTSSTVMNDTFESVT